MSDSSQLERCELLESGQLLICKAEPEVRRLRAEIERLRAALQEIRQLNNHVDHPIIEKIARRALEGRDD